MSEEKRENLSKDLEGAIIKTLVGSPMSVTADLDIQTKKGAVLKVKQGDRGYVDLHNRLHLTTGMARGQILNLNNVANIQIEGMDCDEISKSIEKALDKNFDIESILEANGITKEHFINVITSVLVNYN